MRKRGHPPLNKNSAAATKLLQQANGPLEGLRGGEGRGSEPPLVPGDDSTSTAQLMAKNYKLAKELSEVRIRHREESKNVTRLTMENMNLASRCREAISQAALMKKDLSLQKKKTAEAVAQTHMLLDQLKKHMKQQQRKEQQSIAKAAPVATNGETPSNEENGSSMNGAATEKVEPSPGAVELPVTAVEPNDMADNPIVETTVPKTLVEDLILNGDIVEDAVAPVVDTVEENGDTTTSVALETSEAGEEATAESNEKILEPKDFITVTEELEELKAPDAIETDVVEVVAPLASALLATPSDEMSEPAKDHGVVNGCTPPLRLSMMTEDYDDSEHKTDDPDTLLVSQPSEIEPLSNLVSSDDYESNEENDSPSDDADVVPTDPSLAEEEANQSSSMLRPVTPVAATAEETTAVSEGTPTTETKETAAAAWFDEEYDEAGDTYDTVLGLSSPAKKEYFPHSASPKIHLRYPPAGANDKFEDEFPGDIIPPKIVHPHSSTKKKDLSSLAPLDEQWSSIDAFEASFHSPFSFEESPASDPFRLDPEEVAENSASADVSSDLHPLESNRGIRERATAAFQRNNRHDGNGTLPKSSASPTKSSALLPPSTTDVALPKTSPPLKSSISPSKSTPPSSASRTDQSARWLQEIRASTEKKKIEKPLESKRSDQSSSVSPIYAVPIKPKDATSSPTSEQPTPVFRQFPRSPLQHPNPLVMTEADPVGASGTSPSSLKETLPLESPRNSLSSARSRYVEAASSERGRSAARPLAVTIPSPPSQKSPENGSGSSVNVRERAALYSKASPSSSTPTSSSQWRPVSRSTVKLLDDEGDIPMQTSLSPRKYRSEALTPSSETYRTTTSLSSRGRKNDVADSYREEERYPGGDTRGHLPGRVQATIFDHEDRRWAGKQRRHINLSGGRVLRNGEQEADSRHHPDEV